MAVCVGVIRQKRGPVYVEWDIENYFSYTAEDEFLKSPIFSVSDETKWWLELCPHGDTGSGDYVTFFLMKGQSNKEYNLVHKLGIMKPDNSVFSAVEYKYKFARYDPGYRCPKFLLRSDLLKAKDTVASDGVLRVFCIIRFVDTTFTDTSCGTHLPRSLEVLSQNLEDLYLGGRVCDVTITVKDKIFQAHKSILVARSPVFAAMFEHDMVEKSSNTINITDCDANSFKEFLLFLYAGKVENVSPSNVFGLYETANKYDVKELKEECLQLMEHNLSVDTFSDNILIAVKYEKSELLNSATEFFIENVRLILPTVKWKSFMAENSCLANDLFMKFLKMEPIAEKE